MPKIKIMTAQDVSDKISRSGKFWSPFAITV